MLEPVDGSIAASCYALGGVNITHVAVDILLFLRYLCDETPAKRLKIYTRLGDKGYLS